MLDILHRWYRRYFSDPQAVLLTLILIIGFTVILTLGHMLAPVLAAVVIAYLLEGVVRFLERRRMRRLPAVVLVFSGFMTFVLFLLLAVVPLLSVQVTQFLRELPHHLAVMQTALMQLPERYSFLTERHVQDFIALLNRELAVRGQQIVTLSLASIPGVITLVVYLILVPLLVFFFLKDKEVILRWTFRILPQDRSLATQVWVEMDRQLGNYVRGKFWEILIVGSATWVAFAVLGLKYAILLAALVGVSVLVPYI
ncbi:MAG TPA: AI-2E family transporter, partial [Chromatiales bacterium]|nr:AI-2E family transporter [Chromatiales bacterium]